MIKRLIVEIDKELHDKVKSKASAEGKTLKAQILELLNAWMKEKKA